MSRARLLVLAALLALSPAASAQESGKSASRASREEAQKKSAGIDMSADIDRFTKELDKKWRKKFLGTLSLAEPQIFVGREPGPYNGPPLRIWGNGWGTSLWRDPITGWAIQ